MPSEQAKMRNMREGEQTVAFFQIKMFSGEKRKDIDRGLTEKRAEAGNEDDSRFLELAGEEL